MRTLGERIAFLRKQQGLSQEDLAKMMGYKSRSTINKIELGKNDVAQCKIIEFAEKLNTSVPFLMGWTQNPEETFLTPHEQKLIEAYRAQPGMMQDAVCKLLGIDPPPLPELKLPERSRSASR